MGLSLKRVSWFAALVVTAVVAAGATWFVVGRDGAESMGEPSWLFSQTADAGTFSTDADGVSTLTLTDIDPGVVGFTDRPDRDTAVIAVAGFVEAWPTMFADSAPNAVLVEHQPDGESDSFVVELSDPKLDGTTLSFTAEVLDGEDHSGIAGVTATPHTDPPAKFQTVSLFIDDVYRGFAFLCYKDGELLDPPGAAQTDSRLPPSPRFEEECANEGGEVSRGFLMRNIP